VTHANTAANMKEMRSAVGSTNPPRNIFKEHNGHGMPKRTFTDRLTLGSGNDRIELRYFGRGHTNGDAWVLFPALRVAHAGDIFSGKNIPLLDSNNGGSAMEIGNTLDKAASALNGQVDGIITGHSTVMTVADLREYAQFNKDFLAEAQVAKRAGRSVDEAAKAWKIPARYVGYAAPQEARLRSNVQIAFDETK
jgi:glyoxylase-like metal-dependent hydrolase (beta-lactamase superfamily II)